MSHCIKKYLSLFLSVLLIFLNIIYFPMTAYATESQTEVNPQTNMAVWFKYFFTQIGAVFTGSFEDVIKNSETLNGYLNNGIPHTDDGKGNITVSGDVINNIYNELKTQATALNGYYLLDGSYSLEQYYIDNNSNVSVSAIPLAKQMIDTTFGGYFSVESFYKLILLNPEPVLYPYLVISNDCVYPYSKNLYQGSFDYYTLASYGLSKSTFTRQVKVSDYIKYYSGSPAKLFYSKDDLKKYLLDYSDIYLNSNFLNFDPLKDNKITFNKNEVEKQDWDSIAKKIADEIRKAISNNNLNEEEKQIVIDTKSDEILASLGDIGGGIDNVNNNLNSWLSRIYGKVATITTAIEKFDIAKYFDKVNENLVNITDAVKDIEISSGGGLGALIGGILGGLISGLLDKIIGGEEDAEDVAEQLLNVFTPMVNVSKTKFPFSLPWDTYAVVATLATTPETPKFDIPIEISSIGIKEHFVIDMKDFETLSKLARAFFALTFLLILINLTLKFVDKGGFD